MQLPEGQPLDFKAGGYIQIDIPTYRINFKDFIIEEKFHPDSFSGGKGFGKKDGQGFAGCKNGILPEVAISFITNFWS